MDKYLNWKIWTSDFSSGQLIFLSLAQMDQWPQILNRKTVNNAYKNLDRVKCY